MSKRIKCANCGRGFDIVDGHDLKLCPNCYDNVKEIKPTINIKDMDLRDYFAAKAMQGFLANPGFGYNSDEEYTRIKIEKLITKSSYNIADAMMKERESNE